MEEAAAVRQAASEATADVTPAELRETIAACVEDGSAVPGVLTILSARTFVDADPENLLERAAGVQLIYDGLRLTRRLAREDPWAAAADSLPDGGDVAGGSDFGADPASADGVVGSVDPDMAILAADVLVSRGFYLLARTDAAADAVAVVRAFGRDQTDREDADPERAATLDRRLEVDVLELAVVAGAAAAGHRPPDAAALAVEFAPEEPRFAPAGSFFDAGRRERLDTLPIDGGRPLNRND